MKNTVFDKTEVYNNQIMPLVVQIKQICQRERMPFFISTCIKNSDEGSEYKSDMTGSASNKIQLKQDHIVDYVKVLNGFPVLTEEDDVMSLNV